MSKDSDSWIPVIVWGVVIFWCVGGVTDMWYSKLRYSIQYGVAYDQVTKENKPHDCDWLKAPLGNKECHFEIQVSTIQVRSNQWGGQSISYDEGKTWAETAKNQLGYPIVSNDGGKTWSTEYVPPFTKPQVSVTWEQKED